MPRRPHMSAAISYAAQRRGVSVASACKSAGIHRADAHHGSLTAEKARALAEVLGIEDESLRRAYLADELERAQARTAAWWDR